MMGAGANDTSPQVHNPLTPSFGLLSFLTERPRLMQFQIANCAQKELKLVLISLSSTAAGPPV
jgi:hypothetical protein